MRRCPLERPAARRSIAESIRNGECQVMQIPLPPRTRELIERTLRTAPQAVHPGLLLDKYVGSVDHNGNAPDKLSEKVQKPTVEQIAKHSSAPPSGLDYTKLFEQRRKHLGALPTVAFRGSAVTPLTLHLSRASALENAGLCLHHVYGFAYLPGTGLKGLARSYAETVWFPTQFEADDDGRPKDDAQHARAAAAWQKIEEVFGWSPNSDARKRWKPSGLPKHDRDDASHVGRIVFHDAWPVQWPRLKQDILNCHHRDYYEGNDAPGDWENPVPVYFLAIERGQEFEFALGKRRDDVPDELLGLARQWLVGGLTHFAAGSKTNSGYGSFELTAQDAALPQS
ncbi:MAG: type III-B CRISPR module RAMP protein Cmr6, partial [Planctomycetota bacterium]